jgi:hypothetical protein
MQPHHPLSGDVFGPSDWTGLLASGFANNILASQCVQCTLTTVRVSLGMSSGRPIGGRQSSNHRRLKALLPTNCGKKHQPGSYNKGRKTCRFYRVNRREIKTLKFLMDRPPVLNQEWKGYRSLRYIYYCIIPHLILRLSKDTQLNNWLCLLEARYYGELQLWHTRYRLRGTRVYDRRLAVVTRYENCSPICELPSDKL